jgi:molybdopterin molybdotransferase
MISVEAARARILDGLAATGDEIVALPDAAGRVLAAPVDARLTQPPTDQSAMDGYAVRAEDAVQGARLAIIGAAPAGHPFAGTVGAGQAVRLFTGSVLPHGADSVVLQEDAEADGAIVTMTAGAKAGQHIRRLGQDFSRGETVLRPGRVLGPRDIGLAAAAGHAWLSVHRRPRVAIMTTGDEIAWPGDPLPDGGIASSNAPMLAAFVRRAGADAVMLPIVPDRPEALQAAFGSLGAVDLLVTTGGASVGDHDLVHAALTAAGFTMDFWKIAMRPGKPMMSGRRGGLLAIGLPGNPVSAMVCAMLFLGPALERLSGLPGAAPRVLRARAGAALRANDHRADHLRATVTYAGDGTPVATPFERQDSAMLTRLAEADCLICRAPYAESVAVGGEIGVIFLV